MPSEEPALEESAAGSSAVTDGQRPLKGILVADFSRVLAGPLCSMTLADLGARVIKVERPGAGDDTRSWGPPWSGTGATYFESVNRNKESVCLDLNDDGGRRLARELALRADVLVENFKPGGLARLGLAYPELSAENPGLICVSISGFGAEGGRDLPGYDFVVQALGGLMSITGEVDGPPMKAGVALVDVLTAKDAAIAVLAALQARRSTGRGSHIQLNLLSSLQGALVNQAQAYLGSGSVPARMGNAHPSIVPYQLLGCADGPLAVACGNDSQFARLAEQLGAPDLATDSRFATNSARVEHRDVLIPLIEELLETAPAAVWQQRLTGAGVPAGRVAGIDEGIAYAASLGLQPTMEVRDSSGQAAGRQIRHPALWDPPLAPRSEAPPRLGQHTGEVVAWLRDRTEGTAEAITETTGEAEAGLPAQL